MREQRGGVSGWRLGCGQELLEGGQEAAVGVPQAVHLLEQQQRQRRRARCIPAAACRRRRPQACCRPRRRYGCGTWGCAGRVS